MIFICAASDQDSVDIGVDDMTEQGEVIDDIQFPSFYGMYASRR
jgi:hypothetical protein